MPIYKDFRYTEKDDHIVIRAYCGDDVDVVVPDAIKGKPVTEITHSAFVPQSDEIHIANSDYKARCSQRIRSIHLPDSITSLDGSFNYCVALEEITIPRNVAHLDAYTFRLCENLKAIHVAVNNPLYQSRNGMLYSKDSKKLILCPINHPDVTQNCLDGVEEIGTDAFAFSKNLVMISIPASVTVVNSGAFYCCENLSTVTLHSDIYMAGGGHFAHCKALDNVSYYNINGIIPTNEFYACSKLKKIEFGNKIRIISEGALSCTGLTDFVVPKGTAAINRHAFLHCNSLKRIEIPRSVSRIHKDAFTCCGKNYYTEEQLNDANTCFGMKAASTFIVIPGSKAEQFCQSQGYTILHP